MDRNHTRVLDPEKLPSVLAVPLQEYLDEENPVLKLWHSCHFVEMTMRYLVTAGIADLIRTRKELPQEIVRKFHGRIEQPMMGSWRGMVVDLAKSVGPSDTLVPELPRVVQEVLIPLLDGLSEPQTPETSLSQLRNTLAHGGGMRKDLARKLLRTWEPRLEAVFPQLVWLQDLLLVVRGEDGTPAVLRGPAGRLDPFNPSPPEVATILSERLFREAEEVFLLRGGKVASAWPMALFGPPRVADPDVPPAENASPQMYIRRGEARLKYTPIGSLEVCHSESGEDALGAFLRLFGFDREEADAKSKGYLVAGFEDRIRKSARDLVGRRKELEELCKAIKEKTEGVLWVTADAGMGKSMLMAKAAWDLLESPPPYTQVLAYWFRGGDGRCSQEHFLQYALERLEEWVGTQHEEKGEETEGEGRGKRDGGKDADKRPEIPERPLARLEWFLMRLRGRRVIFFLDGLDEVAARSPMFAREVPLGLRHSGVLWVCAGREERGLKEAFTEDRCEHVFRGGLPKMSEADIREMLIEGIGPARTKLVASDREDGEKVVNDFVEVVRKRADGLPIYVNCVIGDVRSGRLGAFDRREARWLPNNLNDYYEKLLRRYAIGALQGLLTHLVCTLALLKEPLSAEALQAFLVSRNLLGPGERDFRLVMRVLSAVESMIRRTPTSDGNEGFTLYHQSFRDHILLHSEDLRSPVETAGTAFKIAARGWNRMSETAAGPYILRWGVEHLLEKDDLEGARGLLTDFGYLMKRMETATSLEVTRLVGEYKHVLAAVSNQKSRKGFSVWEAFFREKAHILERGKAQWPANRILLQIAFEHAEDSPVSRRAVAWERGQCKLWARIVASTRPTRTGVSACLRVIVPRHQSSSESTRTEGTPSKASAGPILALAVLPDGQLAGGIYDGTVRFWNPLTGSENTCLQAHGFEVGALALLHGGVLVSVARRQMALLKIDVPSELARFDTVEPCNVLAVLGDGRLVSASSVLGGGPIKVWDAMGSILASTVKIGSHLDVKALAVISGRQLVSGSRDGMVRVWDVDSGAELASLKGHPDGYYRAGVRALAVLLDGRLAFDGGYAILSDTSTIRIWDPSTGVEQTCLRVHGGEITALAGLSDGRLAVALDDYTVRIGDIRFGTEIASLGGHTDKITALIQLPGKRLASSSYDGTVRIWDLENVAESPIAGDTQGNTRGVGEVRALAGLPDGHVVAGYSKGLVQLLDPKSTEVIVEGHGDSVTSIAVLSDGRLASGSGHNRLPGRIYIWNHAIVDLDGMRWIPSGMLGLDMEATSVATLPDGRLVSGRYDGSLLLWDVTKGIEVARMRSSSGWVTCLAVLRDGRLASGHFNGCIEIWDLVSRSKSMALRRHGSRVNAFVVLPNDHLASGSSDGTVRIWDGNTGEEKGYIEGQFGAVLSLAVVSKGLLICGSAGELRLVNLRTGMDIARYVDDAAFTAVAALQDGDSFVVGDERGRLRWLKIAD